MFKTDILFTGFYGQRNTGDDAFVEVASWGAKRYWKRQNNRFLAIEKNLPLTIEPANGYPFNIPKSYKFQQSLLLNGADFLISAGGSTIHSKMVPSNPKMKALYRKEKYGGIKVGGIGVSVGPFKSVKDEKAVQQYLKSIDFLALRDKASFDYVNSLDLPYKPINAFDLAALLPSIYQYQPEARNSSAKTIGISVCPYESVQIGMNSENEKKRNNMIVDLLKNINEESNVHFKFYIINGGGTYGDADLTMKTIDRVAPKSYEVVGYSRNTRESWTSIAQCDFVISTRLHAAIFACFAGTPFMLNEYHRKCTDFLNDVQYAEEYRLYDSDYDIKERARQIIDIINERSLYQYPGKVEQMKKLAELNFTHISL